jgi:hypothetical protein
MLGAALVPIALHGNSSNADIYWSLNSSLTTGAIVIYGASRLTARNTALIVLVGCFIGIGTALRLPTFDWYPFGRLVFHLTFVNLAAFSLRETVERHERSLFWLARENLSRNIYAKELEAARAQAEEGNEIKLRFLANMSHEFRTPMNGVMQTLEIASRTATTELAGLIERARRSGNALLGTLNSILEYTRWTQHGLTPNRAPVSLSDSLRRVVLRHEKPRRTEGWPSSSGSTSSAPRTSSASTDCWSTRSSLACWTARSGSLRPGASASASSSCIGKACRIRPPRSKSPWQTPGSASPMSGAGRSTSPSIKWTMAATAR